MKTQKKVSGKGSAFGIPSHYFKWGIAVCFLLAVFLGVAGSWDEISEAWNRPIATAVESATTPMLEVCGDGLCTEDEENVSTCHADCGAEAASCPINSYACNGEEGPCCPSPGYIPVRVERFNNEDGEWYRVTVPTTIPISLEFTPFGGDSIPWESVKYDGHSTVFVFPFHKGMMQLYMVSDHTFFKELPPRKSLTLFLQEDVVPLAYINASDYEGRTMWRIQSNIDARLKIFINGVQLNPIKREEKGEDEELSFILSDLENEEVIVVVTRNGCDYATHLRYPLPRMVTDDEEPVLSSEQRRAIQSRLIYTAEFLPEEDSCVK